jgi:hypothetical protein
MSNNTNRVQSIFIADGTALPANNADTTGVTSGKIGIYGQDMLALDPAGNDTITTQPYIYLMEGKTDAVSGVGYLKRSDRISGANVTGYTAKKYAAPKRETWAIGYNRLTAAGSIEVNASTDYKFSIRFKNDKHLYSERPELYNILLTSSATATQLSIATQAANAINNGNYKSEIKAAVVGDGSGAYGLTAASNYGVEIWALDINQNLDTTYTRNRVYFSVQVDDSTGFGTTTTCTQIQAFTLGVGTYNEVYTIENYDLMSEGVINRRQWPIPVQTYSANSTYITSSAIVPTSNGTTGEDKVTFSATVAAMLAAGDKVSIDGVLYEIKYFISTTVAILTTPLLSTNATGVVLVRVKYDLINIEYNDAINTPTGVVAVANKSIVIAVPAITSGGAYTTQSQSGTDVKAILDAWMASTPRAFAAITI